MTRTTEEFTTGIYVAIQRVSRADAQYFNCDIQLIDQWRTSVWTIGMSAHLWTTGVLA